MRAATVWALPARWYADPEIYEAERRRIFSRQWLWIGREADLAEPGAYLTSIPAGFPLFVRRGEDGALRGFHNVCRHRASRLLTEPSGRCNTIECPYHGWRYRSDGTLDHVPLFGEAADFPREALSLFSVAVDVWRDLVFVCLDPQAPPLLDWLGPIADEVERTAPVHASFERSLTFLIDCNWKTYVDNYQEGYHIPPLHPGLHRDLDWKRYRVVNFEGGSLHGRAAQGALGASRGFRLAFPQFRVQLILRRAFLHADGTGRPRPDAPRLMPTTGPAPSARRTSRRPWLTAPSCRRRTNGSCRSSSRISPPACTTGGR